VTKPAPSKILKVVNQTAGARKAENKTESVKVEDK